MEKMQAFVNRTKIVAPWYILSPGYAGVSVTAMKQIIIQIEIKVESRSVVKGKASLQGIYKKRGVDYINLGSFD